LPVAPYAHKQKAYSKGPVAGLRQQAHQTPATALQATQDPVQAKNKRITLATYPNLAALPLHASSAHDPFPRFLRAVLHSASIIAGAVDRSMGAPHTVPNTRASAL
jgi:hypothetical protein